MLDTHHTNEAPKPGRALSAYLLGTLGFDALLALQRRLVYDISGDRTTAAVILCDHPAGITIGREGSRSHIRPNPEELHARGWPVRWVSRGGGVMLHVPGQVACYPIFSLDTVASHGVYPRGLLETQDHGDKPRGSQDPAIFTPGAYLEQLQQVALDLLREYGVTGEADHEHPGVRVNGRRLIHLGVAIRQNVSCFGLIVNADPDLEPFRVIRCDGDQEPMTSLARESSHRVRVTGVRQHLLELIAARFGFDRVSVFHSHPRLPQQQTRHAAAHRP